MAENDDTGPATDDPGRGLQLQEFLPYRLSVLTNKLSATLAAMYADRFALTVPEWRVMAVLGQLPGLSADQVCAATEMDKVTVSRAVSRLNDSGRLQRGTSEKDRRRSVLALSAAGEEVYRQVIPLAREFEQEILAELTDDERHTLDRLLKILDQKAAKLRNRGGSR
ncbi:MAG: winged helix-turn-helix transcriptional regulator [Gammaproteobacteria bacterium]|nr:MarR family winged helix-turn-helix transcriptional regulator [Gammaproteobacteria bacterium]NNM00566.1 winged helix-turn-helix transcriptional regulator [Gammaproteobacteria bacterium]